MADRADIQPENVEGKYYVDEQCIDCDLCREEAPNNFTRQETEGYSYVYKQPENEEEESDCAGGGTLDVLQFINSYNEASFSREASKSICYINSITDSVIMYDNNVYK